MPGGLQQCNGTVLLLNVGGYFAKNKSHLTAEVLKKLIEIDEKRNNNDNLGVEFSQKVWRAMADCWVGAEAVAMKKIADLYGLEIIDLHIT